MTETELLRVIRQTKIRAITPEAASNGPHRQVLAALCRGFDDECVTVLCEPSLTRTSQRPPDIVVIDPDSGVHVIEVKSVNLNQVAGLDPGGTLQLRYSNGTRRVNPIQQVRNAMFDIKNGTERAFDGELTIPFCYWVAFPSIEREAWNDRWGAETLSSPEILFHDNLGPYELVGKLRVFGRRVLDRYGITKCPQAQLRAVLKAFGDSPEPVRPERAIEREGCLGEQFDRASALYKRLSEEQQRLVEQHWGGPRLIRGVAGSGKTVVLAQNCARRIARILRDDENLFKMRSPRVLAVCFNRTLVPLIDSRIREAYHNRTGDSIPDGVLEVHSMNSLMWHLAQQGLWRYQSTKEYSAGERASHYLRSLNTTPNLPNEQYRYDAVYVDEGQDFEPIEFELILQLCQDRLQDPSMFVFYDDAQNLYGIRRPNWTEIGLNIVGRSTVMTRCFRNTRQIVEPAFNMLVGAYSNQTVQNRQYADMGGLSERKLIDEAEGGHVTVLFADRDGMPVNAFKADSIESEHIWVKMRLRKLLVDEEVRPEDILLLAHTRKRATGVAEFLQGADLPIRGVRRPFQEKEKDNSITEPGFLTVSTVHSAKGYDAYVVIIVGAEEFEDSEAGRAAFYVACTRARELLEITGIGKAPLARELVIASRNQATNNSES